MVKKSRWFTDGLILVSLWGFAIVILLDLFTVNLNPWFQGIAIMLLGVTMMLEAQLLSAREWIFDGLQTKEFGLFVALFVGLVMVIIGFMTTPLGGGLGMGWEKVRGVLLLFTFIYISWQRWITKEKRYGRYRC